MWSGVKHNLGRLHKIFKIYRGWGFVIKKLRGLYLWIGCVD
jgi:hypothetical protein